MTLNVAGASVIRRDLDVKLTGEARYTADLKLPGMLYGAILRSPHPHADVLSVDATEALRLPGVRAVVTPFDTDIPSPPGGEPRWGRLAPDMGILDTRVRFVGDEVAAVAADDPDTARAALDLIRVEYNTLLHYMTPESALAPGAISIHPAGNLALGEVLSLERGSVAEGFSAADVVLEDDFEIPTHSAAPLEPRAALASWGEIPVNPMQPSNHAAAAQSVHPVAGPSVHPEPVEGRTEAEYDLTVWKTTRGVHVDRDSLAAAFGLPSNRVRVIGPFLGAGYGNKDETRLSALAAALSQRAGRPVRLEYSREDEFIAGRVRHAAKIHIRAGFRSDGTLTAIEARAMLDTGAYLASGAGVARRAGQGILYLYHCANAKYEAHLAYTNRPTAGSYRALGAPQGHFALESLMDRAAEYFGIDSLDFRLMNHVRLEGQPGQRVSPPDQVIDSQPLEGGIPFSSNGLHQCLELGANAFGWREYKPESGIAGLKNAPGLAEPNHVQSFNQLNHSSDDPALKRGRGMSIMIYRGGPGSPSAARVQVDKSGAIKLVTGLMDVGEGASTVLPQMAAEVLGGEYEQVEAVFADSHGTPDAPITAGSTATFSTGTAVVQAATEVRQALLEIASVGLEAPVYDLDAAQGWIFVKADPSRRMALAEVAGRMDGDEISATASIIPGSTGHIVNSFGAHFVEVEVDIDTGRVRVLRYVAAHDSGRIINPRAALNQAEGAVSQMLGFALSEELVTDAATGVTLNPGYLEHKSPTILDYPDIQVIFADIVDPVGPLGAKGLGEVPSCGVAPAIANAIHNATGVRLHRTPFTPDRVLSALQSQAQGTNS